MAAGRRVIAPRPSRNVLTAVGRAFWQSLRAELRRRSGCPSGEAGAVTFVQRFGGSLNLNVHLHAVVADGVFVESDGGVRFLPRSTDGRRSRTCRAGRPNAHPALARARTTADSLAPASWRPALTSSRKRWRTSGASL